MSSLVPPLAALSAAGLVMFWRYYRAGDARGWMLPVAVAAELAWAVFLWRDYGGFLPWVRTAVVVAGVIAIVVMVVTKLTRRARARLATAGLTVGVVAALAAPSAWAASVLDTKYGGSSLNASAGPAGAMGGEATVGGAAAWPADRPGTSSSSTSGATAGTAPVRAATVAAPVTPDSAAAERAGYWARPPRCPPASVSSTTAATATAPAT